MGFLEFNKQLFTNPVKAWDNFKNGETNDINKQIADRNFALDYLNFDYQKALQQKIFQREDSAYQRTVADMRAAGLSPIMMNGTDGAGEAIQTQAPQNNYQHQDMGNLNAFAQIFNTASTMNQTAQKAKMADAQVANLNAQTQSQNMENAFQPFNLATSLVGQMLQNKSLSKTIKNQTADYGLKMLQTLEQSYKNSDRRRWNAWAEQFGISENMMEKERLFKFATGLAKDENVSNAVGGITAIPETIEGVASSLTNGQGIGGIVADSLPQSWQDAIEEGAHKLGAKIQEKLDNSPTWKRIRERFGKDKK